MFASPEVGICLGTIQEVGNWGSLSLLILGAWACGFIGVPGLRAVSTCLLQAAWSLACAVVWVAVTLVQSPVLWGLIVRWSNRGWHNCSGAHLSQ